MLIIGLSINCFATETKEPLSIKNDLYYDENVNIKNVTIYNDSVKLKYCILNNRIHEVGPPIIVKNGESITPSKINITGNQLEMVFDGLSIKADDKVDLIKARYATPFKDKVTTVIDLSKAQGIIPVSKNVDLKGRKIFIKDIVFGEQEDKNFITLHLTPGEGNQKIYFSQEETSISLYDNKGNKYPVAFIGTKFNNINDLNPIFYQFVFSGDPSYDITELYLEIDGYSIIDDNIEIKLY